MSDLLHDQASVRTCTSSGVQCPECKFGTLMVDIRFNEYPEPGLDISNCRCCNCGRTFYSVPNTPPGWEEDMMSLLRNGV